MKRRTRLKPVQSRQVSLRSEHYAEVKSELTRTWNGDKVGQSILVYRYTGLGFSQTLFFMHRAISLRNCHCESRENRENGAAMTTYPFVWIVFGRSNVRQSFDLQHTSRVQHRRQLFVGDAHLAVVHETQQRLHVAVLDVPQDHDRMLARISL